MSSTQPKLLQAASDVAGGTGPLAERLGISELMLRKYMTGAFPLPDLLLLRALDLILEHREARAAVAPLVESPADRRLDG